MKNVFPEIITGLPEAMVPFPGIKAWILQGTDQQLVFMEIDGTGKVPEHSHGAQWGIVVEGELKLTIGGVTKTYRKGDHYFIPQGAKHSAELTVKTWVLDFFADRERYKVKE